MIPTGNVTIGVIAPSSPFDKTEFEKGIGFLKDLGFNLFIPQEIFEKKGYLAGDDRMRAKIIMRQFVDRRVSIIMCARGGYGALRLLDLVDYNLIAENPKPLVGFSDVTALLLCLHQRAGIPVFHGPTVVSIGKGDDETTAGFKRALLSAEDILLKSDGPVIMPGTASAPVAGGNLSVICSMLATVHAPVFEGKILFLEDCNEAPYRIDRMLWQLVRSGCLEGIKGLALGSFKGCGEYSRVLEAFEHALKDVSVPVLAGLPAGHGEKNITFPFGKSALLDTEKRSLLIRRAG